jgi:hypothetical protein
MKRPRGSDRYGTLRVERNLRPAGWLSHRPGPDEGFGTVAAVAAPGFPAYARVLHPARLTDDTDDSGDTDDTGDDAEDGPGTTVRWATVAAANGRTVTPLTRWYEVIGASGPFTYENHDGQPGLWDEHPEEGPALTEVALPLAEVLARHTGTPEQCWFGLWEGYGHLEWGPRVPRFHTPGREEILLSGPLSAVTSPAREDEQLRWGLNLPDLWWPQDRAWIVGGDVDLQSTYVGGSAECIAEILAAPGLEAFPAAAGDSL